METSPQINEIAAALALAQSEMQHAIKDSENPAFKSGGRVSRYADLASVIDACRPALAKNGIAIVQSPTVDVDAKVVVVVTTLAHKSGQWITSRLCASVADTRAQTIGSAITYLRRYSLAPLVSVAQDDDDGNRASVTEPYQPPTRYETAPRYAPDSASNVTPEQPEPMTTERLKRGFVALHQLSPDLADAERHRAIDMGAPEDAPWELPDQHDLDAMGQALARAIKLAKRGAA